MLKTVLPICLMLMSAPPAHAFDLLAQYPADFHINPNMEIPRPRCTYSFYVGRKWIQIRDNIGATRDCRYSGWNEDKYFYECMDGNKQSTGEEVEIAHNGWGWIRWVRFNSSEDLSAYCD